MVGRISSEESDQKAYLPLKRIPRQRPTNLRISRQIPVSTLEGRVRLKATQMYAYLQDEIAQIEAGESPDVFPAGIIVDDFSQVRRAVDKINLQLYDISIYSHAPLVYFFGTPKDDGDTEITTRLLFNIFEEEGISRSIFFHDNGHMPFKTGRFATTTSFPTTKSRIYMWDLRTKYNSIIGPDKANAFETLAPEDKQEMMQKIEEFSRDWSSIEKSLVGYLAQEPEERCFAYLQDLVKHMICKETISYEVDKAAIEALRDMLDENIDAPTSLVSKVHELIIPLIGQSVPLENFGAYKKAMPCLPAKIRELRDRRFAYVMQLHEAISPDMERFKAKIPPHEWVQHRSALPNLAGLLHEAKINYAIFVPKPGSVYRFPDSILRTL